MPKATKDIKEDELNKVKSTTKKAATTSKKKDTASSKSTTKSTKTKKETPVVEKKEVKEKAVKSTAKKTSTKNVAAKKSTSETKKKTATKKTSTTTKKKTTASTTKKKTVSKAKKIETNVVAEYYDLPYRYNETVVKILYQTPTILFVYWDISDSDREKFVNEYGGNFFNNTRPVLKIYNLTKNYDFEVEINDFANSWYINVNDADCEYKVELARKAIKYEENLNKEYIHVTTSNDIEFPNDKILLDQLPDKINFRNVKTNAITTKDISTMRLIGINKIYKVHDFYKNFYKDEILEEINSKHIINPSSSSWN